MPGSSLHEINQSYEVIMEEILEILDTLSVPQKHAVEILKTFIDCFNSADGIGLFAGVARYSYLESRCKICAVKSRDIMGFWSSLRQKLLCPIPPKKADKIITDLWGYSSLHSEVLNILATQSAECIMIARMLHDADKSERKRLWQELQAEQEKTQENLA
jgi:hypothetical protein